MTLPNLFLIFMILLRVGDVVCKCFIVLKVLFLNNLGGYFRERERLGIIKIINIKCDLLFRYAHRSSLSLQINDHE